MATQNYSARAEMARALAAAKTIEDQWDIAAQRASTTREDSRKQLHLALSRAKMQAENKADGERSRIRNMIADLEKHQHDARLVIQQAGIDVNAFRNVSQANLTASRGRVTSLTEIWNKAAEANNDLITSVAELQRVRNTLLVRALRKIGLPPI